MRQYCGDHQERWAGEPAGAHTVITGEAAQGPRRAIHGHPLRSCSRPGMREGSQPSTTSGPPRETENTGEKPRKPQTGKPELAALAATYAASHCARYCKSPRDAYKVHKPVCTGVCKGPEHPRDRVSEEGPGPSPSDT